MGKPHEPDRDEHNGKDEAAPSPERIWPPAGPRPSADDLERLIEPPAPPPPPSRPIESERSSPSGAQPDLPAEAETTREPQPVGAPEGRAPSESAKTDDASAGGRPTEGGEVGPSSGIPEWWQTPPPRLDVATVREQVTTAGGAPERGSRPGEQPQGQGPAGGAYGAMPRTTRRQVLRPALTAPAERLTGREPRTAPVTGSAPAAPARPAEPGSLPGEPYGDAEQRTEAGAAAVSAARPAWETERELSQLWGRLFRGGDRDAPRRVMFTAASRREGVTQVVASLALVGASVHPQQRIALVEFNLRHPSLAALFGLPPGPGVVELLTQLATIEDCARSVRPALEADDGGVSANGDAGIVDVFPAGLIVRQPLGLLQGRATHRLLQTLAGRYDHVLIDAPAVNVYPDSPIVGASADGAVLVLRAGVTRRETAAEARKRLEAARVNVLGMVLNQRTYPIPAFLYRRM